MKQAPRAWHNRADAYFCNQGFRRSENDATLYMKRFFDGGF